MPRSRVQNPFPRRAQAQKPKVSKFIKHECRGGDIKLRHFAKILKALNIYSESADFQEDFIDFSGRRGLAKTYQIPTGKIRVQ